jgi:hypothetical protein
MIRGKEFLALVKKAQQYLKSGVSRKVFEYDHRNDIIGKALAGKAYDAAKAIQLATEPKAYRMQLRPGKTLPVRIYSPADRNNLTHLLYYGLGATLSVGSDRYPYTLVGWTANGEIIYLTADEYTRTDKNGQSESQTYTYKTNPDAPPEKAVWSRTQKRYRVGGTGIYLGERKAYLDPGF